MYFLAATGCRMGHSFILFIIICYYYLLLLFVIIIIYTSRTGNLPLALTSERSEPHKFHRALSPLWQKHLLLDSGEIYGNLHLGRRPRCKIEISPSRQRPLGRSELCYTHFFKWKKVTTHFDPPKWGGRKFLKYALESYNNVDECGILNFGFWSKIDQVTDWNTRSTRPKKAIFGPFFRFWQISHVLGEF